MKTLKHSHRAGNSPNFEDLPKEVGLCYKYFLKGITTKEISLLIGVSLRTVQRWKANYQFEQRAMTDKPDIITPKQRVLKMVKAGLSYSEIAQRLSLSKTTVYNYVREEIAAAKQKNNLPFEYQTLFDYLNDTFDILPLQSELAQIVAISKETG